MQVPAILVTAGMILVVAAIFGDRISFLGGDLPGARGTTRIVAGVIGGAALIAGVYVYFNEPVNDDENIAITTSSLAATTTAATTTTTRAGDSTSTSSKSLPVEIAFFEATRLPDSIGCTDVRWSVGNAEIVLLIVGSSEQEVPHNSTEEVCGEKGDVVTLSARGSSGDVEESTYEFPDPALAIQVEATATGNIANFRVTSNLLTDVTVRLLSDETDTSDRGKTHQLMIAELPFGATVEWEVVATASNGEEVTSEGTLDLQYVYARATITDPPTFSSPGGLSFTTTTGFLQLLRWPVAFTTDPEYVFLGEAGCGITYDADTESEIVFLTELDGSVVASFSGLSCLGLFVNPKFELSEAPTTQDAVEVVLPPGDGDVSVTRNVSISLENGESIDFAVQLERVFSDMPAP